MAGFWAAVASDMIIVGFLAGALVGALVSLIVAFSSITLRQSQVAVGFILALTCRDLAYFLGNPIMGSSPDRFCSHHPYRFCAVFLSWARCSSSNPSLLTLASS
jgi:ABC-type uncharacterized transport system permease subunit